MPGAQGRGQAPSATQGPNLPCPLSPCAGARQQREGQPLDCEASTATVGHGKEKEDVEKKRWEPGRTQEVREAGDIHMIGTEHLFSEKQMV